MSGRERRTPVAHAFEGGYVVPVGDRIERHIRILMNAAYQTGVERPGDVRRALEVVDNWLATPEDEEAYEEEGLYRFVGGVFEPVPEGKQEPGEIEAWTYDCQDWSDRDKVPSTIEITVGHYYTGMVPVYVRIRPRALSGREP